MDFAGAGLGNAHFQGATFRGPANFSGVIFDEARFDGATFEDEATFAGAIFKGVACFESVQFQKAASFKGAEFDCLAKFEYEEQSEEPGARRRREVTFGGWADFRGVQFRRGACFGGADFESRARFGDATFGTPAHSAEARFDGARFVRARTLGPMLAWGRLSLDRCSFEAPSVRIQVSAAKLSCARAHFLARTTMEVRCAEVALEDAEFVAPSIVVGSPRMFQLSDGEGVLDDSALEDDLHCRPRIRSVRRANVGNLTLADVNLEECRFVGAHKLDGLRLESVDLPYSRGGSFRRRIIAEEGDRDVSRASIADTYRALRKGREDSKDEPGAADFYYGEMEMRRQAADGFDWWLLHGYWLTSGYALLAWRALAALALTVLTVAGGLEWGGFDPNTGNYWDALLFSAESTTSLFRAPSAPDGSQLNYLGHVLQMGLRLLGPLFFGLMLLALRGRVKR